METVKDILNFCNAAIFYNYTDIGIVCELNQVRKCIINSFHKTIPDKRIRVSLSIIDDIILKNNNNDFEDIIKDIHGLRENILYMLSFEKLVGDEQQTDSDQQLKQICDRINGCENQKNTSKNKTRQ